VEGNTTSVLHAWKEGRGSKEGTEGRNGRGLDLV
tara:strand:- start:1186 stop:1287 length:102 start_codon:yes stop_codon:yes gene_type:complete